GLGACGAGEALGEPDRRPLPPGRGAPVRQRAGDQHHPQVEGDLPAPQELGGSHRPRGRRDLGDRDQTKLSWWRPGDRRASTETFSYASLTVTQPTEPKKQVCGKLLSQISEFAIKMALPLWNAGLATGRMSGVT